MAKRQTPESPTAVSIADQVEELAGRIVTLAAQDRRDGITEARTYLARRLVEMVAGQDEDNLLACLAGTAWADYLATPDFRAGVRWAATMIADQDFDY
jgi:hypothetical protein